jgi:hypothetical protein
MRVLVCGDRNWIDECTIERELENFVPSSTTVIHGAARGADSIGGKIAKELGMAVEEYPALWDTHGKAAGPIRNRQMLDSKPDLVLAFHDNLEESRGTKHMVEIAKKAGIETKLFSSSSHWDDL